MTKLNRVIKRVACVSATWLCLLSCSVADEDRCLDGYTWDPEIKSCRKDKDTELDTETESSGDTEVDSGVTGDGGPDTDTGEELPTGLGEMCTKDGNECANYEANHCLYDPTKPTEPGICTIKDCVGGDCPSGYQCCDVILVVACLPDESAEEAIAGGASCPP